MFIVSFDVAKVCSGGLKTMMYQMKKEWMLLDLVSFLRRIRKRKLKRIRRVPALGPQLVRGLGPVG